MHTPVLGTLARLLLVVPAAGWLLDAAHRLFGAPFPGRGLIVGLPMHGSLQFEQGTIRNATGELHVIDFGPWWLVLLLASVLVLAVPAWRGCRFGRAG